MPKLQNEVIVADGAMRPKAAIHLLKINRPPTLMDLHGIPSAKGDVGTAFPGQMNEIFLSASAAPGTGLGGGNLGVFVGPEIEGEQSGSQTACSHQIFRCLRSRDGRYQIHR